MGEAGERLRAARIKAGYVSAAAFWRQHGFKESTYNSHEAGGRGLARWAEQYAAVLRRSPKLRWITASWLQYGEGGSDPGDEKTLLGLYRKLPPEKRDDFLKIGNALAGED